MAVWVALASPVLFRITGDKGPFDPGQPVAGTLRLVAVLGVLVCLAARRRADANDPPQPSMLNRGAVGPFVGGLLLVAITGFTGLSASTPIVYVALVATAVLMLLVRFTVPPLKVAMRRILVSPFVLVAGGLYWSFIAAVVGTPGAAVARHQASSDPHTALFVLGLLVVFSGVYYAMLIYAPRQVADREGGTIEWLIRYAAFVASIVLGIAWLGVLGT